MVAFILAGSTAVFKKSRYVNVMGLLTFWHPAQGSKKCCGQLMAAIRPGQGACQGLCASVDPLDCDAAGC